MDLVHIGTLRFACVPADGGPAALAAAPRHAALAAAADACRGRIAVFDAADPAVPLNLDPYEAPAPVTAGGGVIVRDGGEGPEVLLIHRRGAWDLPKGKLDAGEDVEACAVREVREEVGVERIRVVRPLGETVHGYPEKGRYRVKTTYWYLMTTPETRFTPQADEGIEAVEWTPWDEAGARFTFGSLRRLHAAVTDVVSGGKYS